MKPLGQFTRTDHSHQMTQYAAQWAEMTVVILTLSAHRGTDGSFQPAPSVTIVLFLVTALPRQVGL